MADNEAIKAQYPQLAYLIDDPEIGPILAQANEEGWASDKFQAAIMATNWWKRTSSSERQYQLDTNTDPATANQKLEGYRNQVRAIGGNLGYDLDAGYVDFFATKMYREGLNANEIQARMVDEITPLIGTTEKSPILAEIRKASQDWGVTLDTATLNHWLAELGSGRASVDNLNEALRAQASDMFPHLGKQFEAGQTFKQVTDPYRQVIASTLEIPPDQVDFVGDAKWRSVLTHVDPTTGATRLMSINEAAKYARNQPEWQKTTNFRDRADSVVNNIRGIFTNG